MCGTLTGPARLASGWQCDARQTALNGGYAVIDWLTARIACSWSNSYDQLVKRFRGGRIVAFLADGTIDWETVARLPIAGSHDSRVMVRAVGADIIEFSGNPAKFLSGHNLFGGSDPALALRDCMHIILQKLDIKPDFDIVLDWRDVVLSVVDVNRMYQCNDDAHALEMLRYLGQTSSARNRGLASTFGEGTVYIGNNKSRFWSCKMYAKSPEQRVNGAKKMRDTLVDIASGTLRVEFRLKLRELKKLGLDRLENWTTDTTEELFDTMLKRLTLPQNHIRHENALDALPFRLRGVIHAWMGGGDLRTIMKPSTFRRNRLAILDAISIDILAPCVTPPSTITATRVPSLLDLPRWVPTQQQINRLMN